MKKLGIMVTNETTPIVKVDQTNILNVISSRINLSFNFMRNYIALPGMNLGEIFLVFFMLLFLSQNVPYFHLICLLIICRESLTNVNEISSTLSLFVINKSIAVMLCNISSRISQRCKRCVFSSSSVGCN